jgi:hypothetical protein
MNWFREPDWKASENPHHLLAIVEQLGVGTRRKYRLAAVACCRRFWNNLPSVHREAVETAERYADGNATYSDLKIAANGCRGLIVLRSIDDVTPLEVVHREARLAMHGVVFHLLGCAWGGPSLPPRPWSRGGTWGDEARDLAGIIRDVFGNPFRPVTFDPAWITSQVLKLAQSIYDERVYDRLPILGDALEAAGCDNADILSHCRELGTHVRGCWVVDAILGKSLPASKRAVEAS